MTLKNLTVNCLLWIIFGFLIGPGQALSHEESSDVPEIVRQWNSEIKVLVEGCWAKSKELRDSGVTAQMTEGANISADCIRSHILRFAEPMYDSPENLQEYFIEPMNDASKLYIKMLSGLYQEHEQCRPSCGTIQGNIIASEMVHFYHQVLDKVYRQNRLYEYSK